MNRKKRRKAIKRKALNLLIGSLLVSVAVSHAGVICQQTFDNSTGINQSLTHVNWNANVYAGTAVMTSGAGVEGPILSRGQFLYTHASNVWLAWTDEGPFSSFERLSSIHMTLRNATVDANIRVALKVDGIWMVSREPLNNSSPNRSEIAVLEFSTATWDTLSFVSGTSRAVGEAVVPLSSGSVEAVGVFVAGTGKKVRLDDFTLVMDSAAKVKIAPETISSMAEILVHPGSAFGDAARTWQGVPGIERASNGRLWATWYSGGPSEGQDGNYGVVVTSGDDGQTWSEPRVIIRGPGQSKIVDPLPWIDPRGRLWVFYRQITQRGEGIGYYYGTCAIRTDHPGSADPVWTPPIKVHPSGCLFGKPIIRDDDAWVAPFHFYGNTAPGGREASALISTDEGDSWEFLGGTTIPKPIRNHAEPAIVQRENGDLWMLIRRLNGLSQSLSTDNGQTWSAAAPFREGPHTRVCMRKLNSGALLLIYHDVDTKTGSGKYPRNRLAAWLSDDEGRTWPYKLLLDERRGVSYPDAMQTPDGRIYFVYDRFRYIDKEILMGVVREEDIRAGKTVSPDARLKSVVNRATGWGNRFELGRIDEDRMREDINKKMMNDGKNDGTN